MFFQIILATLIGILFGTITGLTPGIHINLISVLILSLSPVLSTYIPLLYLTVIIISMAITHTFLDTIPSIFLGAPDEETVLSVLPGHRMLLQGKGYEAVMLTVVGSLASLILILVLFPLFSPLIQIIYPFLKEYIGYILIAIVTLLILREHTSKIRAFFIFFIAGILGLTTLNLVNLNEPLFPLLSGLFGISLLVTSINQKTKIPKQIISSPEIDMKLGFKATITSVFAGSVCSFMPGLGPSQAAIFGSQFVKDLGDKGFLILVGGLNTVNIALSLLTLYVLDKARNGAILTISRILEVYNQNHLILFIGCALVAAGIATILATKITKVFSKLITKVNYTLVCLSIILLITVLVTIISGFLGLLVLTVATFVGMLPSLKGVGKNHLMGCLLLPVIMYFLL